MATEAKLQKAADLFSAKMRARRALSDHERNLFARLPSRVTTHQPDEILVETGDSLSESLFVVEGFAARFKDLSDGRRQVLELNVPGDFIDLHGYVLPRIDQSIMTLTPATIAHVPHAAIAEAVEEIPHLGFVFWFQTALDAAIHREWVLSLGQRSAVGRMAHFFCEMKTRLGAVGLADDHEFDLPITQNLMSEIIGMTAVHVSRTLKVLRDTNVVTFKGGKVRIHDWHALAEQAEFDPTYLNLS